MSDAAKQRYFRLFELASSGNLAQADLALTAAVRTTPKEPNILHLAAQVAERAGDIPRAILLYRRAMRARPHWFEATMNLVRLLGLQQKYNESLILLQALAPHHPDRIEIQKALAHLAQASGDLPVATATWNTIVKLHPQDFNAMGSYHFCLRQLCDWREPIKPDSRLSPKLTTIFFDDPALQKESAEIFCAKHLKSALPLVPVHPYLHDICRVGYLSSDFHAHATSWLIAELFALHNRSQFEIYAYSYGVEDHSSIRQRLRDEADHFIELNTYTPAQCAQRIRDDEIDILIDLKGHTHGSRLDILAMKPAPVQLHWLGYPGTTGADFIDGFIADFVTVPSGNESFFTEKVLRMPHAYQINDREKEVGPALTKEAYGLPEGSLVLASFNQTYKLTPEIFSIWCEVLNEIPQAVLWLYESNPYAPDNLRKEAAQRGINPNRLHFAKPAPLPEHLARYHLVDLALDTFPVGGHTTTSDALWVGAPVITLAGHS
ncbi:MAG: hypothetical protein PHD48_08440, partial [Alphaproteobacteria bacterium]|nr:hypothetical protein [Alphaproteobacteria bacterium]